LAKESLGHCTSVLAEKYNLAPDELDQALDEQYSGVTAAEGPPFPRVIDVCQYICSIGGKNVIATHRARRETMELLAAHNIVDYFAGCLTRDDGYPRKPDPAIFQAALVMYQLKREETLTIGDRDIDILAGQAVGILSCLYGTVSAGVKANLVISNFHELYQYLLKHNSLLS